MEVIEMNYDMQMLINILHNLETYPTVFNRLRSYSDFTKTNDSSQLSLKHLTCNMNL